MSEVDVIEKATDGPVTVDTLTEDLRELGVGPGSIVLVHSSLSSLGWVCGGAAAVVIALQEVVRSFGTVVMPTHSGDLSDPAAWQNPPVPEPWWDIIREKMPPFDPELTPSRGVGVIPEVFRSQPETVRSNHPQGSFAAWGADAIPIINDHQLTPAFGRESPLGRIYDRDGLVLLLGVGYENNTSFHLAECIAEYGKKRTVGCSAPVTVQGHRRWKQYEDVGYDDSDFREIGRDFEHAHKGRVRHGRVGYANATLFKQRDCVDFTVKWLARKRR